MSDREVIPTTPANTPAQQGFVRRYLISHGHLITMVVLGMAGAVYTDLYPAASLRYWQLMAPVFCLICIASQWSRAPSLALVRRQVLHWGVFLGVMQLLFLPPMQHSLDSDVTGIFLLVLLALSTFLAGVYLDWRFGVVGVFLGICAVLIAFLDEAAAMISVAAIAIVAAMVLWHWLADKIGHQRS